MNTTSPLCFYGYEQRTNVSRLFKIYATPSGLFFGWIADRDHEEMLARFAGTGIGQPQAVAAAKNAAQVAAQWESHYDTMDVEGDKFLQAHDENFAFADGEASVTWKLKWTEKAATRFGALDIVENGKKRRFYLVGQSSPAPVIEAVRLALPSANVEAGAEPSTGAPALLSDEAVPSEPVYKRPNWPVIITVWVAAIGLSLWIAARFNFWIPLGACVVAPYFYKMMRFGNLAANMHKDTAEQLRRDRAK